MRRRLASTALVLALGPAPAVACDRATFAVLLDVGHTPAAPGATSARGKTEYAFNLALTLVVEKALRARGYARTARLGAAAAVLGARGRAVTIGGAKADLLLSLHHDSVQPRYLELWTHAGRKLRYSDLFKGFSLFVSGAGPRAAENLAFARLLADALMARGLVFTRHHAEKIPGENRPWLDSSRGIHRFDALAVLRAARAPAALLEAGVIVNRDEETALGTPARQGAIAAAVVDAVDRFCAAR